MHSVLVVLVGLTDLPVLAVLAVLAVLPDLPVLLMLVDLPVLADLSVLVVLAGLRHLDFWSVASPTVQKTPAIVRQLFVRRISLLRSISYNHSRDLLRSKSSKNRLKILIQYSVKYSNIQLVNELLIVLVANGNAFPQKSYLANRWFQPLTHPSGCRIANGEVEQYEKLFGNPTADRPREFSKLFMPYRLKSSKKDGRCPAEYSKFEI